MRPFIILDVFTDRPFAGNQLPVVFEADGLSTERMQAIAREFNHSETTFVLQPESSDSTARVRIFTPHRELPFAGHPNVGTAFALALHRPEIGIADRIIFEEAAGLVDVRLLRSSDGVVGAEIIAPEPLSIGSSVSVSSVAACLSLNAGQVRTQAHQPTIASVGLPILIVELDSRESLRICSVDPAAFWKVFPLENSDAVFAYCRAEEGELLPVRIDARLFYHGLYEDPATGSAAAAMAALVASFADDDTFDAQCIVSQGEEMGRPSRIAVNVARRDGRVETVSLAGECVAIARGTLDDAVG